MNQSDLEQQWKIDFIRDEKDELTLRYAVFNQSSKTKKVSCLSKWKDRIY